MHWDHEPRRGETVPPRCCRHLPAELFSHSSADRMPAAPLGSKAYWSAGKSVQSCENTAQDRSRHDEADAHNAPGDDPTEILGDGAIASRDILFFVEVLLEAFDRPRQRQR